MLSGIALFVCNRFSEGKRMKCVECVKKLENKVKKEPLNR